MEAFEQFLEQAPRLNREDSFEFACHAGLACFNACCRDLTIELSPFDVLRLRRALGLGPDAFLKSQTRTLFDPRRGLPVVQLKMRPDEQASCPFVSAQGCSVYPARPTACRLYPVGRATPPASDGVPGRTFYFLLEEDPCQGYDQAHRQTVQQWLGDQGVDMADGPDGHLFEICQHPTLARMRSAGARLDPRRLSDYHRAFYDPDRFREYLIRLGEPERLGLSEAELDETLATDEGYLAFAAGWLRGRLFGEKPLTARPELEKER